MDNVKITVLVDNFNGAISGYVKDFGFAALIEKGNVKVLFDTGTNPEVLRNNLHIYGVSFRSLNAVILSHNHYDHTNGLTAIVKENPDIPIYVHKYWDIPVRYCGVGLSEMQVIVSEGAHECNELTKGIYLTNTNSSGDYGGIHEHACYIQTDDSYILICGCCHPGLNKFLSDRSDLDIPMEGNLHFIGGMHSFRFTDIEAEKLNPYVKSIILCHCTQNAKTFFKQFGDKCQKAVLGKTISYSNK